MPNPIFRKSNGGNICIRNLDPEITQEQLIEAFSNYGEVLSCKIQLGKSGQPYGVAYIQFKNPDEAQEAIDGFQGATINGQEIEITEFNAAEASTNIHIKSGIPLKVSSKEDLVEFLNKIASESDDGSENLFESLDKAVLLKHPRNTEYRQAYLTFTDFGSTARAQKLLEEHGINCERCSESDKINHMKQNVAEWNQFKAKKSSKTCLFVRNIPRQVKEDDLSNFFGQFADVSKCVVNEKGLFANAFVTFRTEEGAKMSLQKSVLACSYLIGKDRRDKKYPTQLFVTYYLDKDSQIKKNQSFNKKNESKVINDLKKRVENEYSQDSMQYCRVFQLSDDQIFALAEDEDLYEDWADEENNKPYDMNSDDFDDDDDESTNYSQQTQKRSWRGNYRPQRGRGYRGQSNYRPYSRGRVKRGGYNNGYNYNRGYNNDDFESDDDEFD